ncbi:MAG: hypothetical protein Q9218_002450 [Villophora microphyllina]
MAPTNRAQKQPGAIAERGKSADGTTAVLAISSSISNPLYIAPKQGADSVRVTSHQSMTNILEIVEHNDIVRQAEILPESNMSIKGLTTHANAKLYDNPIWNK